MEKEKKKGRGQRERNKGENGRMREIRKGNKRRGDGHRIRTVTVGP